MTFNLKQPHEIIDATVTVPRGLILLNVLASIIYLYWWFDFSHAGVLWLYIPLLVGEIYHVFQALAYAITIWNQRKSEAPVSNETPPVDVFITVCGEPTDIVKKTVTAALAMDYPNFNVYVLNDGRGRKAENWKDINKMAIALGAKAISRKHNIGAKAGNINNALKETSAPFITIFDADHVPYSNYLKEIMPYFNDEKLALAQAPQYYQNRHDSFLTTATWEQQELFFGSICRGKSQMNSTFWCGTNAVVRRKAIEEIGGVPENNIAEDFLASLFMHEKGWNSVYISKILAEGLAPHNLQNYVIQQFRWARGSSELIFKYNPIFKKNLTLLQKIQYIYSSSYYLNGFIVLIDILVPIIVLLTGVSPVTDQFGSFIIFFLPFIFSTIYLLMASTENTITFRAIQLSMSSSFIYIKAVLSTILNFKSKFNVTSKEAETGNFIKFAIPHIMYMVLGISVIIFALIKQGITPSVLTNSSWIIFNIGMFFGFIRVSYPWRSLARVVVDKALLSSILLRISRNLGIRKELINKNNV